MWYYTRHKLEVKSDNHMEIIDDFRNTCDNAKYSLTASGGFTDGCKWYSRIDDLKHISKKYPDTLFILTGEGEDYHDNWREYYMNGKLQRVKGIVTYPEFDVDCLK